MSIGFFHSEHVLKNIAFEKRVNQEMSICDPEYEIVYCLITSKYLFMPTLLKGNTLLLLGNILEFLYRGTLKLIQIKLVYEKRSKSYFKAYNT